jgi:uncharacterized membrane protein
MAYNLRYFLPLLMNRIAGLPTRATRTPLGVAGVLLGLGLGGFADGIVLHQMLQWHHMLTSAGVPPDSVDNLELNMLWEDGIFHASTWVFTVIGLVLLWRAMGRRDVPLSTSTLAGALLLGWGTFNLVEGVIDHHILRIHHVNETVPQAHWIWWDLGFLVFGLLLVAAGSFLLRAGRGDEAPAGAAQRQQPLA